MVSAFHAVACDARVIRRTVSLCHHRLATVNCRCSRMTLMRLRIGTTSSLQIVSHNLYNLYNLFNGSIHFRFRIARKALVTKKFTTTNPVLLFNFQINRTVLVGWNGFQCWAGTFSKSLSRSMLDASYWKPQMCLKPSGTELSWAAQFEP